ncbi:MAG: polyprenol monophosphomannose synthase [Candidatus Zipacnadales bacterium]
MRPLDLVFIVTATYNERGNLRELHRRLRDAAPEAHVVIVDDASPDGTADLVRELMTVDRRLHLLERSGKLGYASAHQDGMTYALERGAQAIVTLDADLSHDPAAIARLVEALESYDVVIGSRYARGGGFVGAGVLRRLLSGFANLYVRAILGLRPRDCTSGFRAYRAEIIQRAGLLQRGPEGYVFLTEALWRCARAGAAIGEVPIVYAPRLEGRSKMSLRIISESAWRTIALRCPRLFA